MPYDPKQSLTITVGIPCPMVVTFRLWYRTPSDPKWTQVANDDSSKTSTFSYTINQLPNEVPAGSSIKGFFHFLDSPNKPYKVNMTLEQQGKEVVAPVNLAGFTNAKGTAVEDLEVDLP